jgi:hypothetical protein
MKNQDIGIITNEEGLRAAVARVRLQLPSLRDATEPSNQTHRPPDVTVVASDAAWGPRHGLILVTSRELSDEAVASARALLAELAAAPVPKLIPLTDNDIEGVRRAP